MSFECNFNPEVLAQMLPHNTEIAEWFYYLDQILPDYEITSALRIAAFMAQCAHESGQFTVLKENLNYTAEGLHQVFSHYFPTLESAQPYAHQPERIANRIYGGRMGNGPEETGDGWKFHGRGIIQITGRSNYTQCSQDLYTDDSLIQNPDRLLTKEGAIYSACWFWYSHDLNTLADAGDMITITKKINGGTLGLNERMQLYSAYLQMLG
jgi:putative chitinase